MNKLLILTLSLAIIMILPCWGNPLPPYQIGYVRAFPPEIGIFSAMEYDISGGAIITSLGTAFVNQGIILPANWGSNQPFILDSSNTSGFTINSDGDSIAADLMPYWEETIRFGLLGWGPPPIKGHYLTTYDRQPEFSPHVLSFDFAKPRNGYTNVIINEINTGSTWNRCSNFIELYNKTDNPISLNGWRLVCDTIFDFPANASISGHGFYVVDECDFPAKFGMDFNGDNIYLIAGDSTVDQVGWSSGHGPNVSFMRYPDGDANAGQGMSDFWGYNDATSATFENGFPARGAANRYESPGFVTIGAHADSMDYNQAQIRWTNPLWDQSFSEAIVVRSLTGYVAAPNEGQTIYQGIDDEYLDSGLIPAQTYYYTIFARKYDNTYSIPTSESQTSIVLSAVNIDPITPMPANFGLSCYPNPFNARTNITFSIPESGPVTVAIYDIAGKLVEILADRSFEAGDHSVIWDAGKLPSAVYFYSIKAGDKSITRKAILLK